MAQNQNTQLRIAPARMGVGQIDRQARVIQGVAVISRGEALGHGLWIDGAFLDSVVEAGNANPKGIKARWTHPDLFSDGMGTYLGRIRGLVRDGDVVRGDLHISAVANESPKGPLGDYVLSLASDDPEAFGLSIVFDRDLSAESSFMQSHSTDGKFASPDADNSQGMAHARLHTLYGADVVDEPACNPAGLFATIGEMVTTLLSRMGIYQIEAKQMDKLEDKVEAPQAPEATAEPETKAEEGVCPHCGQAMPEGESPEAPEAESVEAPPEDEIEDKPEDEMSRRIESLEATIAQLSATIDAMAKAKGLGGQSPVGFRPANEGPKGYLDLAREYAQATGCKMSDAFRHVSATNPDALRRYQGK